MEKQTINTKERHIDPVEKMDSLKTKMDSLQNEYMEMDSYRMNLIKELLAGNEKLDKGMIPEELVNETERDLERKKKTIYELVQIENFYIKSIDRVGDIFNEMESFGKRDDSKQGLFPDYDENKIPFIPLSKKQIEKKDKIASSKNIKELIDNLNEMGDFIITRDHTIKKDDLIEMINSLKGSEDEALLKIENVLGLRDKVEELLLRQELEVKQV
jgi:hypothetical protein